MCICLGSLPSLKKSWPWTSQVVQWLRLQPSTAGDTGSILGRGSSACRAMRPKRKKKKSWPCGKAIHLGWGFTISIKKKNQFYHIIHKSLTCSLNRSNHNQHCRLPILQDLNLKYVPNVCYSTFIKNLNEEIHFW